jgi:uroporphyrinogen III methyltransferase/synthase
VDVVALYDTVAEPLPQERLAAVARADYVTFTASSTVRFFMEAVGREGFPGEARVVSIGPVTSQTLREHELEVHVEAEQHDIDGLVAALVADAR